MSAQVDSTKLEDGGDMEGSTITQSLHCTPYNYKPVHKGEIRCLRLLSSTSDTINIEIKHFRLDDIDDGFLALSYTWGEPDLLHVISVQSEGAKLGDIIVRQNCWDFLQQWRTSGNEIWNVDTWLWIDAICINQDDVLERNQQVQQMDNVFATAHVVLMWLGKVEVDSKIVRYMRQHIFSSHIYHYARRGDHKSAYDNVWAAVMLHLHDILVADYWSRLWIVQELHYARSLACLIGPVVYDLEAVSNLRAFTGLVQFELDFLRPHNYDDLRRNRRAFDIIMRKMTPYIFEKSYRFGNQGYQPHREQSKVLKERLLRISGDYNHQQCSNFRDRVFGLRGLLLSAHFIHVDYSINHGQLFSMILEVRHAEAVKYDDERRLDYDSLLTMLFAASIIIQEPGGVDSLWNTTLPLDIAGLENNSSWYDYYIQVRRHALPQYGGGRGYMLPHKIDKRGPVTMCFSEPVTQSHTQKGDLDDRATSYTQYDLHPAVAHVYAADEDNEMLYYITVDEDDNVYDVFFTGSQNVVEFSLKNETSTVIHVLRSPSLSKVWGRGVNLAGNGQRDRLECDVMMRCPSTAFALVELFKLKQAWKDYVEVMSACDNCGWKDGNTVPT